MILEKQRKPNRGTDPEAPNGPALAHAPVLGAITIAAVMLNPRASVLEASPSSTASAPSLEAAMTVIQGRIDMIAAQIMDMVAIAVVIGEAIMSISAMSLRATEVRYMRGGGGAGGR
jgi:hypothetical protein